MAWPSDVTFQYNNVVRQSPGPEVHWHDSHRFCTTSTLQLFLYRTRCRVSILVQQHRMTKPLATLMRALFTGGAVGYYHSSAHPPPPRDPILNNPIRIVDLDGTTWWEQLEQTLGQANPVNLLKTVATLDRFQGLQAPVILASLVSGTPGIMHDIWRSNTLLQGAIGAAPLYALYTLDQPPHPWCMDGCTAGCAVGSRFWDCERHP